MPPWLPEQDCRPILHERVLSADEIATFEAWQAQGFPLDDEADYVASEASTPVITSEADIRLDAGEDYVADPSSPDDYRCFVVDDAFEVDTFIKAVDVKADQTGIVHHVSSTPSRPSKSISSMPKRPMTPGSATAALGARGSAARRPSTLGRRGHPRDARARHAHPPAGSKIVLQLRYNLPRRRPVPLTEVRPSCGPCQRMKPPTP